MDTITLFKKDKFAEYIGIELLKAENGTARAKLVIQPFHMNGVNTIQGGAVFTLADLAFAAAANSRGKIAVSLTSSISFLNGANSGTLYAEAKEVSMHQRASTYHVNVIHESGKLIASYEGTAYRKDISIEDTI